MERACKGLKYLRKTPKEMRESGTPELLQRAVPTQSGVSWDLAKPPGFGV